MAPPPRRRLWERHRSYSVERRLEALEIRVEELQARVTGASESTVRWQRSTPGPDLTWGEYLSGDAFVRAVDRAGGFGPSKSVLEIGPGYGRLLASMLGLGRPFARFVGIDLSADNVGYLRLRFRDPRAEFVAGDVVSANLPGPFDTVISSLVFKHLVPTFEPTLVHLRGQLRPHALVIFDLRSASRFGWISSLHHDPDARPEATYVRRYRPSEVRDIVARAGYELVGLSSVEHDARHVRMLVTAQVRPAPPA